MQSIGDLFANNKILFVAILVIVVALIGGLIAVLARMLFGRRISTGGTGRSRQPRLGVVDAFDLDRQRQLVIVRRDNIEHLLMIGGPNDLVIESSILRAAPAVAPGTARDKDVAPSVVLPSQAPATSVSAPALPGMSPSVSADAGDPFAGEDKNELPAQPDPALPQVPEPAPAASTARTPPPVQMPPRPPSPFPPRPLPAPIGVRPAFPPPRPAVAPSAPRPLATPTRPVGGGAGPLRPTPEKVSDDSPRPADDRGSPDTAMPAPSAGEPPPAPKPPSPPPRPPRPEPPTVKLPLPPVRPAPPLSAATPAVKSLDALESLEEEMAKLLGRPVPPADKS